MLNVVGLQLYPLDGCAVKLVFTSVRFIPYVGSVSVNGVPTADACSTTVCQFSQLYSVSFIL